MAARSGGARTPRSAATPQLRAKAEQLAPTGLEWLPIAAPAGSSRRTVNTVLVTLVLAYVLISVLQVDADLSRGWTFLERFNRLLGANWDAYEMQLRATPVATKTAINCGIYLVADWLSQQLSGAKPLDFDTSRVIKNGAIGAFFGPLVCAYYSFSDDVLPPMDPSNIPYKILMDQTLYAATKYSMYLGLVGLGSGKDVEQCKGEIQTKLLPTLQTGWKFWPLVHLITYNAIPPRHRILWINCVDLVWVTILASIGSSGSDQNEAGSGRMRKAAKGAGRNSRW